MKEFLKIFIIAFLLSLIFFNPAFASGGDAGDSGGGGSDDPTLEVEINTGPRFHEDDEYEIEYCTEDIFWAFFPMDFLYNGSYSSSSSQCPNIEFFDYSHELCWVLDLYTDIVSPAFLLSMMVYAVFHL